MGANLNQLAREIIEKNQYMTIGTADSDGNPWVSPVVYAYDNRWNFYFVSIPDSKHCTNIKKNNKVALAIFDSRQLLGEGVGLQTEGEARVLNAVESLQAAAVYFRAPRLRGKKSSPPPDVTYTERTSFKRKCPYGKLRNSFNTALKSFLQKKIYRFYKVTPTKVWMNDPNAKIDVRVGVELGVS